MLPIGRACFQFTQTPYGRRGALPLFSGNTPGWREAGRLRALSVTFMRLSHAILPYRTTPTSANMKGWSETAAKPGNSLVLVCSALVCCAGWHRFTILVSGFCSSSFHTTPHHTSSLGQATFRGRQPIGRVGPLSASPQLGLRSPLQAQQSRAVAQPLASALQGTQLPGQGSSRCLVLHLS